MSAYHKIFKVTLKRDHVGVPWGLEFTGGFEQGSWMEVTSVEFNSPCSLSDIRPGDLLVSVGDDLALFMASAEDVDAAMARAGTSVTLTFERGRVRPLSSSSEQFPTKKAKSVPKESIVTIVLDKDKGIFAK